MVDSSSLGFLRVGVVIPEMRVADVDFNTRAIIEALATCSQQGCQLALFPELGITGYTCGDLFYQPLLLSNAEAALVKIAQETGIRGVNAIVGLPVQVNGKLFNCAAFLADGQIYGLIPKTFLPNTNEFYEARWFSPSTDRTADHAIIDEQPVPFATNLLFYDHNRPECVIGIEVCEDLWAVNPPSGEMALAGALVLCNISASNELLGKSEYRRELVKNQSARCLAAYCYTSAGPNESTTDVVYSGHGLISENGKILVESQRLDFDTQIVITDIDLQRLNNERLKNASFSDAKPEKSFQKIPFYNTFPFSNGMDFELVNRIVSQTPFVPADPELRAANCREIFTLQATALAKRLKHTDLKRVTLGVSGGLDSTLALLVLIRAFDLLKLPRNGIVTVTMPGFGTSSRTHSNAKRLAELLGVTLREVSIRDAVSQHFRDIDQDFNNHDIAYENAQARERTQVLMDIANQIKGLNIGTGDLSELALGWSTYNGDQMSMYHVNAGVPKTLVRYLIEWCADSEFSGEISDILCDICLTPISAELLPPGNDEAPQVTTETTIGPYVLHDFFLYYSIRYQFTPAKIFFLAKQAFGEKYSPEEILKWMKVFFTRFSQQFKRSAMPDGPKVGSVALSPRGDWRMPSDASGALWQKEIDLLMTEIQKSEKIAEG